METIKIHIRKILGFRTRTRIQQFALAVFAIAATAILLAVILRFSNHTRVSEASTVDNSAKFGVAMGATGNGAEMPANVRAMGAKKMRVTLTWAKEQPNGANDPVGKYKTLAENAQKNGVSILGVLSFAPAWAQNSACKQKYAGEKLAEYRQKCEPRSAAEYGIWAGKMADYYKDYGIHTWEIWNEPNLSAFWRDGNGYPNPKLYTSVLKNAYDNIKWFNRSSTVVMGGLAAGGDYSTGQTRAIDARMFLQLLYVSGLDNKYDALAYHPYTFAARSRPDFDEVGSWNTMYKDYGSVKSIRHLMQDFGAGDKKIWATEYGVITGKALLNGSVRTFTQDDQLWNMRNAANLWKSYSWAGNFYWFNYEDFKPPMTTPIPPENHSAYLGLIENTSAKLGCNGLAPTGRAKKSYCWYKNFLNDPLKGWAPMEADRNVTSISGVTAGACKFPQPSGLYGVKVLVGRVSSNASHSSIHFVRGGSEGKTDASRNWFNNSLQIHQINHMNTGDKVLTNVRMNDDRLLSFGQLPAGSSNTDYVSVANINSFCD